MLSLARLSCLGEALRDAFVTYKSNIALIEAQRHRENGRWTFKEVRQSAESVGAFLQAGGLDAGARCAILMSNQSKWVMSGLAVIGSGAVIVPVDYKLTAPEQAAILRHARPRALVVEYPAWRSLSSQELPDSLQMILVSEAPDEPPRHPKQIAWEAAAETDRSGYEYRPRERDDVASIVYSSGTGGTPKGCMLSHGNYLSQAEVLGQMYPMGEDDAYFSILPTNHAIDFMCGFILPLLFGGRVVHQRTLRPEFIVSTMKSYEITHIALVPMILKALERRLRDKLEDLPDWKETLVEKLADLNKYATRKEPRPQLSRRLLAPIHAAFGGRLRLIFCGGAFVDKGCAEFFYRLGLPVVIGYGLTEACTVATVNDLKPFRGDTVGSAVSGVELQIQNQNGSGVGEVWLRGPTVMLGYLDEPELTAEAITDDGWLRTGDLGKLDTTGHLQLLGRAKNMIVTEGGKNIYPEDIEHGFEDLEGCEEYCVFAANYIWPEQTMTGEQLTLVLRPKKGADGSGDEFLADLQQRNRKLADFKRIASYLAWDEEFPRTASMKIKRGELARQIREKLEREALVGL